MPITLNGTTGIVGPDGSAASPAIQGSDNNTGMFFPAADTIAFAEGGAEVARFNSSGNLGIGTSSPAQRLHVFSSVAEVATLESNFLSTDNVQLRFRGTSGERWAIGNNVATGGTGVNFDFYDLAASANRVRIDGSGRFLLGTNTAFASGQNIQISSAGALDIGTSYKAFANGNWAIAFNNPSTSVVGQIVINSGSTSYNTTSDYRLKENVQPMTGALARVATLKPCTYTWKADGSVGEGFIAHELQAVCPGAVSGEKDAVNEDGSIKPQGVDTSFLVATLTAAIQEQQAMIVALKAEVDALKGAQA